jgi:CMP-N-acetylneuraminic acid synthetase
MRLSVLGIVPARGGSRGVPRKNVKRLCGKPLLQYTAEAALSARRLSRVILSTDDEEIAECGHACGLEVPFLRPTVLAEDTTPMLPVIQHALAWAREAGQVWDAVCILQPTVPLRRAPEIDACIALLDRPAVDSAMTVVPVPDKYNPSWVYWRTREGLLRLATGDDTPVPRRQDLGTAYHRDGSVYAIRSSVVEQRHSLYGHRIAACLTDPSRAINIDTPADWRRAERWLRQHAAPTPGARGDESDESAEARHSR